MDLRKLQAQTLLGPINRVLEAGEFKDIEEPVEKGDKIISVLNRYEKAIYTVLDSASDVSTAKKKIIDSAVKSVFERNFEEISKVIQNESQEYANKFFFDLMIKEHGSLMQEARFADQKADVYRGLLWKGIEERVDFNNLETDILALRRGWKVVIPEETPDREIEMPDVPPGINAQLLGIVVKGGPIDFNINTN